MNKWLGKLPNYKPNGTSAITAFAEAAQLKPGHAPQIGKGDGGLIYVDDGSSSRSIASQLAGTQNLPFAKADVVLDTVPTTVEIDHALARLEMKARDSGIAPRLRDYGIDIAEAPTLAREAMKQTRLLVNNPCEISEADARRLYEAAW